MKKNGKIKKETKEEIVEAPQGEILKTEKEKLLELYDTLKALNVNSIGDLEVKISRL